MGGVIAIVVLSALVICFVCVIVKCSNLKVKLRELSNDLNALQMTERTRQEQIRQNGEINRVEMQEIGRTIRAMIERGMSREEKEEHLALLRENLNYVRERATSRMDSDGEDETQIFKDFLDEMHIPYE